MQLSPYLLAFIGVLGVLVGRLILGRWYNHLSLYSLIWGASLTFFELRWITYRDLPVEIWILLGYAWIAFAMGAMSMVLARRAIGVSLEPSTIVQPEPHSIRQKRFLAILIVALSLLALTGALQHWSILLRKFGSVANVLLSGALIYRMRVAGQLPGMVPYLDSLGLVAAFFAGIYCARCGRLKLIAILPLIIIFIEELVQVARAKLATASLLFISAYLISKIALEPNRKKILQPLSYKLKRLLPIAMVIALLIAGAEFVREMRGGGYGYAEMSSKFPDLPLLSPSIYLYLSTNPAMLSAYWKAGGEEPAFPGSNTFSPIYRILIKLGIADDEPRYPKFYNVPIMVNTGTYLRELHADFGIAGILVGPFLLGFICTVLWLRIEQRFRFIAIALLAHLYVVVVFTFLLQASRWGFWAESLLVSLFIAAIIEWHFRESHR